MFVNEVVTKPRFVEERKFVERTISSRFKDTNVTITTIFMNDEPILKQYIFDSPGIIKNFWKSLRKQEKVSGWTINKGLDITV